ncbi:SDR family NAD(P)-dependent oxidoreductase [Tropicimonas sp.]|uniref:SDR family NAD(P)-dependent oxidoreductase n=1 Tax=Tropicimonas sp. TaxID=2067044 RepID=UPI003A87787C
MNFEGKSYIITGGAGGIGLASAHFLAKRGARLVLAGRSPSPEGLPNGALYVPCDVSSRQAVDALIATAVEAHGLPDGVVTSAGIDRHHDFFALDDTAFAEILDINVLGTFRVVQAVARLWAEQPRQMPASYSAVLVSSINAVIATPTHTAYATSKGAIAQLTRVLAVELAPYGIRVNAMAPGTVRTALLDALLDEKPAALDSIHARTPMRRVAEAEEIAAGIGFLLSDHASYFTGQSLYADGGRTAQNLSLTPISGETP